MFSKVRIRSVVSILCAMGYHFEPESGGLRNAVALLEGPSPGTTLQLKNGKIK